MNQRYITKDIGEASTLLSKRFKLIEVDRKNGICWFVFPSNAEKVAHSYWFDSVQVNAKDFYESFQTLKRTIFSTSKQKEKNEKN